MDGTVVDSSIHHVRAYRDTGEGVHFASLRPHLHHPQFQASDHRARGNVGRLVHRGDCGACVDLSADIRGVARGFDHLQVW